MDKIASNVKIGTSRYYKAVLNGHTIVEDVFQRGEAINLKIRDLLASTASTGSMLGNRGMELLPLHYHGEYMQQCYAVLNSEWPGSRRARMSYLEESWDCFPICFVLVWKGEVLAHCRLNLLNHIPFSAYVTTVVIHPELRGTGLLEVLMEKIEDYGKSIGLRTLYLTTQQEEVCAKLGFVKCDLASVYRSPKYSSFGSLAAATKKTKAAASSHVFSQCSSTSSAVDTPSSSTSAIVDKPSTSAAVDKPSTSSAVDKPSTSSAVDKPSTSSAVDRPTSSTSTAMDILVEPEIDTVQLHERAENVADDCNLMPPPPPPPPVCDYCFKKAKFQRFGKSSKTYMKKDIV